MSDAKGEVVQQLLQTIEGVSGRRFADEAADLLMRAIEMASTHGDVSVTGVRSALLLVRTQHDWLLAKDLAYNLRIASEAFDTQMRRHGGFTDLDPSIPMSLGEFLELKNPVARALEETFPASGPLEVPLVLHRLADPLPEEEGAAYAILGFRLTPAEKVGFRTALVRASSLSPSGIAHNEEIEHALRRSRVEGDPAAEVAIATRLASRLFGNAPGLSEELGAAL